MSNSKRPKDAGPLWPFDLRRKVFGGKLLIPDWVLIMMDEIERSSDEPITIGHLENVHATWRLMNREQGGQLTSLFHSWSGDFYGSKPSHSSYRKNRYSGMIEFIPSKAGSRNGGYRLTPQGRRQAKQLAEMYLIGGHSMPPPSDPSMAWPTAIYSFYDTQLPGRWSTMVKNEATFSNGSNSRLLLELWRQSELFPKGSLADRDALEWFLLVMDILMLEDDQMLEAMRDSMPIELRCLLLQTNTLRPKRSFANVTEAAEALVEAFDNIEIAKGLTDQYQQNVYNALREIGDNRLAFISEIRIEKNSFMLWSTRFRPSTVAIAMELLPRSSSLYDIFNPAMAVLRLAGSKYAIGSIDDSEMDEPGAD